MQTDTRGGYSHTQCALDGQRTAVPPAGKLWAPGVPSGLYWCTAGLQTALRRRPAWGWRCHHAGGCWPRGNPQGGSLLTDSSWSCNREDAWNTHNRTGATEGSWCLLHEKRVKAIIPVQLRSLRKPWKQLSIEESGRNGHVTGEGTENTGRGKSKAEIDLFKFKELFPKDKINHKSFKAIPKGARFKLSTEPSAHTHTQKSFNIMYPQSSSVGYLSTVSVSLSFDYFSIAGGSNCF